ncbi:ApbE family protein [Pseudomonas knackmussii B13]|uniref:FAD:protein FMN transferase n=1 Tax=Pseudomonas knackmussii (strain DSM 6978 / CCUG 54928 / LMG 23759 / B13) TaxID=1301098 RepID=A0A024HIE4_PSEKB|nr:FAD:protein FMN transferase [Pseudomonas knackmussii]CDF84277.1 ApbE family protein [Pseudomonas knackmussii B13]
MKTCSDLGALQRYSLNGPTMGSRYSAVFHAAQGFDTVPLAQALYEAVDDVDWQMSSWRTDSDLMRFNALPPGEWMTLPANLVWVLQTAVQVGAESGGAFDIAVADLVQAWGFGPGRKPADCFSREALERQARVSASAALEFDFDAGRVRKRQPVRLDLGGIAKGFGVDQLARALERHGIHDYLVSIDGELRAAGSKPDGSPWTVAIEKPEAGVREAFSVLELGEGALATSGDYRHFHDLEGHRVAHTMDPRRAVPLDNPLASVSVLAPSCMLADAWATALLVLGPEAGPALACERGMSALFLLRDGDAIRQLWILEGRVQD